MPGSVTPDHASPVADHVTAMQDVGHRARREDRVSRVVEGERPRAGRRAAGERREADAAQLAAVSVWPCAWTVEPVCAEVNATVMVTPLSAPVPSSRALTLVLSRAAGSIVSGKFVESSVSAADRAEPAAGLLTVYQASGKSRARLHTTVAASGAAGVERVDDLRAVAVVDQRRVVDRDA